MGVAVGFDADGDERPFADEGAGAKGVVGVKRRASVALHKFGVGGLLRFGGFVQYVFFDGHVFLGSEFCVCEFV